MEIPSRNRGRRTDSDGPVLFSILNDSQCTDCGQQLLKGSLLHLKEGKALCLTCADLDHLEYLPRGNPALTRRARRHSRLAAVVVRFSRSRRRYERQGILVEPEALEQAETECLADADVRAARQQREAVRRTELDRVYVAEFAAEIRRLFPDCPAGVEARIAEHACRKYSGRVGRSEAAKQLNAQAVFLAVQAHVRHRHTGYDDLLMTGRDRADARLEVETELAEVLSRWRRTMDDRPGPKSA